MTPGLKDRAGQVKGTDFANFYVAGTLVRSGQTAALHDTAAYAVSQLAVVPELAGTFYLPVYGPQVALFFAPFAALPYLWALVIWVLISSVLYGLCCWTLWKAHPNLRHEGPIVTLLALSSPAFFNLVAHGQNSAVILACFTGFFLAWRGDRKLVAGLFLGSLIFKPQMMIVAACMITFSLEWRAILGAIIAASAQLGLAWLALGSDAMSAYVTWLRGASRYAALIAIKPYQMHSLYTFWSLLVPFPPVAMTLYAISAVMVIGLCYWLWRSQASLAIRFAVLLLATVLVSPHLYVYDLLVLTPALLTAVDWTLGHPDAAAAKPIQRLVYACYVLPLAGVVAQVTHVQLSVLAMAALTVFLVRVGRSQFDGHARSVASLEPIAS